MTYQSDLLDDVDAIDVLITILGEGTVCHHGVLGARILVIHRDDHRIVVLDTLRKFKGCQVVDIECDLACLYFLADTGPHTDIVDVVFAVRRVEHLWGIVRVLLLSDAKVDANVGIAQSVILEGDV